MTKNQIIIDNELDLVIDTQMLAAILPRCAYWFPADPKDVRTIRIGVFKRQPSGWLEYSMVVRRGEQIQIAIGCIQRAVGAEIEFHS